MEFKDKSTRSRKARPKRHNSNKIKPKSNADGKPVGICKRTLNAVRATLAKFVAEVIRGILGL